MAILLNLVKGRFLVDYAALSSNPLCFAGLKRIYFYGKMATERRSRTCATRATGV